MIYTLQECRIIMIEDIKQGYAIQSYYDEIPRLTKTQWGFNFLRGFIEGVIESVGGVA